MRSRKPEIPLVRRPIQLTYEFIIDKLGDPSQLPIRKQMCLSFLKWGYTCDKEDRAEFVALAKRFRKEDNRRGGKRTLLEVKARKLFSTVRRHEVSKKVSAIARKEGLKRKKEKTGIHSEELSKKRKEQSALSNNERKFQKIKKSPFLWKIRNIETGEVVETRSLRDFRDKYGITVKPHTTLEPEIKLMGGVWIAEKYNPEW